MPNSGTVTAGSAALASQYNNLRSDVLDTSTGHTHTGASENGAKVAATGVSSGTAANGAVLTADGSGAAAFLAAAASGGILKYQEFTSSGSFVIPASASSSAIAVVEIVNAGVGGQSGAVTGSGTAASGGGGGGGGSYGMWTYLTSTFGTAGGTVTVTIAAGGAGGTATTATSGVNGSFPGSTSFGSLSLGHLAGSRLRGGAVAWLRLGNSVSATGASNAAGTQTSFTSITNYGEPYLLASGNAGSALSTAAFSGVDNDFGGGGGGGGGYIDTSNTAFQGGKGGKRYDIYAQHSSVSAGSFGITFGNGPAAGTAGGGAGGTPTAASGDGGGGGGAATSGNGGAGGAGAQPGGGGGGGGAARTGGTSGAGGAGGNGRVRVWVIG